MRIEKENFMLINGLMVDLASPKKSIRTTLPISKGGLAPIWLVRFDPRTASDLRDVGYAVAESGPREYIGLKGAEISRTLGEGRSDSEQPVFLVAKGRMPSLLVLFCCWELVGYARTVAEVVELEARALEEWQWRLGLDVSREQKLR